MEIIRVTDLSYSYGLEFGLKKVSLSVSNGEVVTLLGPNGSGKTTLIKCINALILPKAGCIYVCNEDVLSFSRTELAKVIGYVPQSHNPSFPFSVSDVVLMGRVAHLDLFQQPSRSDKEKADQALGIVGLLHLKDRIYTQISGGERQLTLIARALAQEPKVLILDEPTAHLDFKNQITTLRVIKRLAKDHGMAVIMSLHEPNHALLFSDKVALMSKGSINAFGEAEKVITKENIQSMYGIDVDTISHDGMNFILPKLNQ
ncbi:MAG: ABC transporter ATP-binding protein [Candidatus Methanomethylicus sp.]|nr:ABC transporter ATP-binding protein [Candidatus Methanomethylicus sp.]